jgi:hypothetical protein
MSRIAPLLVLIAALAGTPLRQAEAAADLCRSLTELLQPADIEVPDGGVGDDSGLGTLSGSHASVIADPLTLAAPLFLPLASVALPLTPSEAEGLRERVWWPPTPPNRRRAWLQIFLF